MAWDLPDLAHDCHRNSAPRRTPRPAHSLLLNGNVRMSQYRPEWGLQISASRASRFAVRMLHGCATWLLSATLCAGSLAAQSLTSGTLHVHVTDDLGNVLAGSEVGLS